MQLPVIHYVPVWVAFMDVIQNYEQDVLIKRV
jgi:hypothetical protein